MNDALPSVFSAWESFYVIVGSSAAALTGLQFVVIALVSESRAKTSTETISAFGTPMIVHFCAAFFVAVALSAPWRALSSAALVLGIGEFLPLWASALLVGGGLAIVAGALAFAGFTAIKQLDPKPRQTVRELEETTSWMKRQVQQ
mgnify:CR=1 FL=1